MTILLEIIMNLATLVSTTTQPVNSVPTIKELRAQLAKASGAPVSPKMSQASIILALSKLKDQPHTDDANVVIKPKTSKPVLGIGARILKELKAGTSPKDTLQIIHDNFGEHIPGNYPFGEYAQLAPVQNSSLPFCV
jgi:hypothetical protein